MCTDINILFILFIASINSKLNESRANISETMIYNTSTLSVITSFMVTPSTAIEIISSKKKYTIIVSTVPASVAGIVFIGVVCLITIMIVKKHSG